MQKIDELHLEISTTRVESSIETLMEEIFGNSYGEDEFEQEDDKKLSASVKTSNYQKSEDWIRRKNF